MKLNFVVSAVVLQLFSLQSSMAQAVKFDVEAYQIQGNTLLSEHAIEQHLKPYTGPQRDLDQVKKAAQALQALYRDAGYPVVQVVAPEQTLTEGRVTLKVVEDKITVVDVKGNTAYSADNIRRSLPSLQTGQSLNAKRLEAAITLANENSAKQVAVNVQPGTQPGDIGTTINVTEDRVTKWVATYDNTGSEATGVNKIGLTYQNANLFDRDHGLTVQYNGTTENFDKVYSFSLGYHVPFYQQGLSADVVAAYSSSSGQNVNLYFAGQGTVLGARLNYALANVGDIRHKLIGGIDYKDSESVSGLLVTPISEIPLSLSYSAQVARPEFQGNLSASWIGNLSGGAHGSTQDYYNQLTGTGARPPASPFSTNFPSTRWSLLRFNGGGGFALPNDWQARVGINAQYSGDLLLPSEQFGAGGATSVRGYPERIISGDEGYSANIEIYTPELNKSISIPNTSLRGLLFWDVAGVTRNDRPLPAGLDANIEGVGFGLRLTYKKDLSLKFDLGWAQKAAGAGGPSPVNPGDTYGTLALSYVF